MADILGRISIPTPTASGLTFPLVSDFGYSTARPFPIVEHHFGELSALATQRYQVGIGARTFQFKRAKLNYANRTALLAFFESMQGSFQSFTYNAPQADQTTVAYNVIFETAPLSVTELTNACQVGFNFLEIFDPATAPVYTVAATCLRFPSTALATALLDQVQQIVPLVHIRVRDAYDAVLNPDGVPDIYLSDRRVTVAGQLYLPRLMDLGEAGTTTIMSQDISGAADNVQFTFGNADRVMTALSNDTDLRYATIDLSLYHVNSGILLQLWSGFILTFATSGGPTFTVQASDGTYEINMQYPTRVISRTCWKTFNDGAACPWATTIGHKGDGTSCDYYFDSVNGCQSHGMDDFFGGQPAEPQGVFLKDNTTGFLGFQRNRVTATSIISDTIWGQPLQEIYCNDGGDPGNNMPVNAAMIDVRDEGDYEDTLGIVGAGPIGQFTGMLVYTNSDGFSYPIAPMSDGNLPQGFSLNSHLQIRTDNNLGLREIPGVDPQADSLSLGQGTPQVWGPERAAGTAFVELRYQNRNATNAQPSGFVPSAPEQHSMTVPISQGLAGWTWDPTGATRTLTPGLTNPFWIAINSLLRCLGLFNSDSTTQLDQFVLSSLIVGDGSGTAEIADLTVPVVVGTGSETQFQFQGSIGGDGTQKPFRDQLTQILNCGLGFFTWEFGRLKLGIRENSGAVDAYTRGNIIFQSLTLSPIESTFEHLIIDFADRAYAFQANTADYQDKSHAAYYGRAGAPLTSRLHSLGSPTLSQNLRIAATRTREEIGGVTPAEWRNARRATWQTTLLGLGNEVGQVVSMTHPDIPGMRGTCNVTGSTATWVSGDPWTWAPNDIIVGDPELIDKDILIGIYQVTITAVSSDGTTITTSPAPPAGTNLSFRVVSMDFRIERWTLRKDWSVLIEGQTVTASMYDLDYGPKPLDVIPSPLPAMFFPIPLGPCWAPYQIQADPADALYPGEWTFDSDQEYPPPTNGTPLVAVLIITGKEPVTAFAPSTGAPGVDNITQSPTGGNIAGGTTWRITIVAYDANGLPSAPANIQLVQVPAGTNTNQIVFNGITWPLVTGLASFGVFASNQDDLICGQQTGALTAVGGTGYTPASVTINGPFARSTYALPSPYVTAIRLKAKMEINGGIAGAGVTAVSATTIVASDLVDPGSPAPSITIGRIVSVIGRPVGSTPFASFLITDFDPATGTMTVDRDPSGIVQVLDAIVIRCRGYDNSTNPTSFIDEGFVNITNAGGGLSDPLQGEVLRVIAGKGRGQTRKITDNNTVSVSWDLALFLDATSVVIIEEATWRYSADSTAVGNADATKAVTFSVPVDNYLEQPMVISGFTLGANGVESLDMDQPVREDWVFPHAGLPPFIFARAILPGVQAVATDVLANRYHVKIPASLTDVKIGLYGVTVTAKIPPASADSVYDVLVSRDSAVTWTSLFGGTPPTYADLPSGNQNVTLTPTWAVPFLFDDDQLRVDCLAADGTASGLELLFSGTYVPLDD